MNIIVFLTLKMLEEITWRELHVQDHKPRFIPELFCWLQLQGILMFLFLNHLTSIKVSDTLSVTEETNHFYCLVFSFYKRWTNLGQP